MLHTGNFDCSHEERTNLEGVPDNVGGDFDCSNNKLESLQDVHKSIKMMNGTFYAHHNPIRSHVMGLLFIKGCRRVVIDHKEVDDILNKYLPNDNEKTKNKVALECQSVLLDAGFEDYAQL